MLTCFTSQQDNSFPHHRVRGSKEPPNEGQRGLGTRQLQLHRRGFVRKLHLKRRQEVVVVAEVDELRGLKHKQDDV